MIRQPSKLGANVTVPYKEAVLPLLDELDDLALEVGAVNTIVNRGGRLVGYNTDAGGFLQALRREGRFDPLGRSVVVIGAGGVARAVSFVLVRAGAKSLVITDIIAERAHGLVSDLERSLARALESGSRSCVDALGMRRIASPERPGAPVAEIRALSRSSEARVYVSEPQTQFGRELRKLRLDAGYSQARLAESVNTATSYISQLETGKRMPTLRIIRRLSPFLGVTPDYLLRKVGMVEMNLADALLGCDLLVNCTPMGMKHSAAEGQSPLAEELIPEQALIYDVVYNPVETPLLIDAKRIGARTLGGLGMLVYQGAAAFELWTGIEAPTDIMFKEARKGLTIE
jgi:shikimate 5-dehydrogenase